MSPERPGGPAPVVIPPPPAHRGKRLRTSDRVLFWLGAFVLGGAIGYGLYQAPLGIDPIVDEGLAALASVTSLAR